MKKLFLFIMLLCCSIVFTGCSGTGNSFDGDSSVNNYRITVSREIIDSAVESLYFERAASTSENRNVKLYFNNIEYPGHSFDTEGNYIFTKVMYYEDSLKMLPGASSTVKLYIETLSKPAVIVFQDLSEIPTDLFIDKTGEGINILANNTNPLDVYYYNDVEQSGLKSVKSVKIEKLNSMTAKVTFFNALGKGVSIDYTSWKISGVDIETGDSGSYTYTENETNSYFLVTPCVAGDSSYYTITLTNKGESKADAAEHTLDNTEIKIDEIKKNGNDVLKSDVLKTAVYHP
ncbi:MAG: hypothetical protein II961_02580 [Candidatus Riflebacteria bacterium]|nr:hypothetical protein [Candidatus Riflebacteria bacterium]